GLAVELFERGRFPKEKPCGEGLMPAGVGVLQRHSLAEAVGGAPFRGVRYYSGRLVAEGRFPTAAGLPATGRGQRRYHLDHVLFTAATATPGVTAYTGARVTALPCGELLVAGLAEQSAVVGGAEASMRRWLSEQPLLQARLEGAEQITALSGMAPLASRARVGVTRGAVLLGDAAGFLDPITGG